MTRMNTHLPKHGRGACHEAAPVFSISLVKQVCAFLHCISHLLAPIDAARIEDASAHA